MGMSSCWDPQTPEHLVAQPENAVRGMAARQRLAIREPIHYGSWSGRTGLSYQDIVVLGRGPNG